ncbi:MAG: glycosyltransferase, partial [Verrucomicrobiota bacterium]
MGKKIAIVASYTHSLIQFRGRLIEDLIGQGCEVIAFGPCGDEKGVSRLKDMGVRFVGYRLERAGLNPIRDLRTFLDFRRGFSRERPDVVISYTAKPMVYGSLAAACVKVPRIISLVTGLGYSFSGDSVKQ